MEEATLGQTNRSTLLWCYILDRIFVSFDWKAQYPLVTVQSLNRVGSDRNPLVVETKSGDKDIGLLDLNQHEEWVLNNWPNRNPPMLWTTRI
jgi:hypothetical protein